MINELKAWIAEGQPRKCSGELDRKATVQLDSKGVTVWCYDYTLADGVMFGEEVPPAGEIQKKLLEAKRARDLKKLKELQASLGVQDGSI